MKKVLLFISLFFSLQAMAQSSSQQLCDKLKSCVLQQSQQMDSQTKSIMNQAVQGMCSAMLQSYDAALKKTGMQAQAERCIDSMLGQSCEQLMNEQSETPACAKMRNLTGQ